MLKLHMPVFYVTMLREQMDIPEVIPRFYYPRDERVGSEAVAVAHAKMDTLFSIYPDGLTIPAMKELVKEVPPYTLPPFEPVNTPPTSFRRNFQ